MTLGEIREKVCAYGTDSSSVFGGFEGGIRIQQHVEEYSRFLHLLQEKPPKSVLEIGSAQGGNLRLLWDLFQPEHIVLIDNNSHDSGAVKRVENLRGVPHIELIGDSEDSRVIRWAQRLGPYDLVFIDGHHYAPYPQQDCDNYARRTARGGILAFHDTAWAEDVRVAMSPLGESPCWRKAGEFHEGNIGITAWRRTG